MKRRFTLSLPMWLIAGAFFLRTSAAAFNLGSAYPVHGIPGESIGIEAVGVNVEDGYTATMGGVATTISELATDKFTLVIPAGAVDGAVEISDGTITRQLRHPIEISRVITGQFIPPRGVSATGYAVGTFLDAVALDSSGLFSVRVPRDFAGPLWAMRGGDQPVFLSIVQPSTPSVIIDSASTAKGLVFMLPSFFSRTPAEASLSLNQINSVTGLGDLSAVIATYSADGASYFEDVRAQAVMETVFGAALASPPVFPLSGAAAPPPPSNFKPGQPGGTVLRDLNPDWEGSIPATAIRLKSALKTNSTTAGYLLFELGDFDPDKTNPADWFSQLFDVPSDTFSGFQAINNLSQSQAIVSPADVPYATGFVRANLKTSNGDLVERVSEYLGDLLTGDEESGPTSNQFLVDAAYPGVYLAHSYSGNLWYGTDFFFTQGTGRRQSTLMTQVGGYPAWYSALAENAVIVTFNSMAAAGFEPLKILGKDNERIQTFFESFFYDFNKAITAYLVSGSGSPHLDSAGVRELLKTTYYSMIKGLFALVQEDLENEGFVALLKLLGNGGQAFIASQIDIMGRLSDGLQAVERTAGLTLPDALALERSIFVIGNPFDPRIRFFAPKRGRTGDIVTIHGEGFGESESELSVRFISFNGTVDPDDPLEDLPVGNSVEAEILDLSDTMVAVRVPTGMEGQFPGNQAFIAVLRTGKNLSTTFSNPISHRTFEFVPPPTIVGAEPDLAPAGHTSIAITGTDFDPSAVELYRTSISGPGSPTAETLSITPSRVNVAVRTSDAGPHTVTLKRLDKVLGSVNFTTHRPAEQGVTPNMGVQITATSPSLADTEDNVISLGEAMMIANGQLTRPLTSDGNLNDGEVKEEDFYQVTGHVREITYTGPTPVVLPGTLPVLAPGWIYHLPMLDGSNLPQGTPGLHVTVDGVTISVGLRNFSGHGLHISGGAKDCTFTGIDIENPGGHGVFLDGDAANNHFFDIRVTNPGGHGAYLSGVNVQRNTFRTTLDNVMPTATTVFSSFDGSATGYGVLIEGGARFNAMSFHKMRGNLLGGACIRGAGTEGNIIGQASKSRPTLREISNNGGPGVLITDAASHTICRWLHVNNNRGDGILVDGASNNHIEGIFTGFKEIVTGPSQFYFIAAPAEERNDGHGIRLTNSASFNVIGSRNNGTFFERGCIANNAGSGIVVEGAGTDFNIIGKHNIGDLETFDGFTNFYATLAEAQAGNGTPVDLSNGEDGVVIRNGASENIIGGENSTLDLHISGASNGAGILIDSTFAVCANNEIIGNQIGSETNILTQPGLPRFGIHLKGPCSGTVIGRPGTLQHAEIPNESGDFLNNPFFSFRAYNVIGSCTEAGIFLEDVANNSGFPNRIQNNYIGVNDGSIGSFIIDLETIPNRVGIKMTGECSGNQIGGGAEGEGNTLRWNAEFGILLDTMGTPIGGGHNEFRNNRISDVGEAATQTFNLPGMPRIPKPTGGPTPLVGAASGTGIVFRNVASQAVVFGESIIAPNEIFDNEVGVHFDAGSSGLLRGCHIHDNRVGGVVLTQASTARVGGSQGASRNSIHSNGEAASTVSGGVIAAGAMNSVISGNWIGIDPQSVLHGNIGNGVYLRDCNGVVIGGRSQPHGNTIGGSTSHGVVITGTGAIGNRLEFNLIGTNAAGGDLANTGDGVRIEDNASGNFVGGDRSYVSSSGVLKHASTRNTIAFNASHGVNVVGAAAGNRILHNSIYSNGGQGIAHTGGGNNDQLPPITGVFTDGVIAGHVPNPTAIPAGSIVEAFADRNPAAPEGEVLLGTATVRPDGTWSIPLAGPVPFNPALTLTATHASTGSTSQFGVDVGFQIGLRAFRTDEQPPSSTGIELGPFPTAILPFSLAALNTDVAIRSLTFQAAGSLDDVAALTGVSVFRDHDRNGRLGDGDPMIINPMTFDADNGGVTFHFDSLTIPSNETLEFLLVYHPSAIVAPGETFSASLQSVNDVAAQYHSPPGVAAVPLAADFPLASDSFTTQASPLQAYLVAHFGANASDPLIGGWDADPDGDGLSNLAEFLFGLDPNLKDAHLVQESVQRQNDTLVITFKRPAGVGVGLDKIRLEASQQLSFWTDAATLVQLNNFQINDNGDGTETVQVTVDAGTADQLFFRMMFSL